MNKLTAEEILEILEEKYEDDIHAYALDSYPDSFDYGGYENSEALEKSFNEWLGLGELNTVASGFEGRDTWYTVKYFEDHDVYIETTGYYSSYNGYEFEDGFGKEVRPAEKTITVYK